MAAETDGVRLAGLKTSNHLRLGCKPRPDLRSTFPLWHKLNCVFISRALAAFMEL